MEGFQFFHERRHKKNQITPNGGKTFCIQDVSTEIFTVAELGDVFQLDIGIALCHSEDLYNKKVGRLLSLENIRHLDVVVFERTNNFMTLFCKDLGLYIKFKYNDGYSKVRMIGCAYDQNRLNMYTMSR